MQRVRLTLRPVDTAVHPVYELITGGADYLSSVELLNWNVADRPIGLLHRIEGDRAAFAAALDEIPQVLTHDITPITDDKFYIYLRDRSTQTASELFETFCRNSLIVVWPIEYHQDGTGTLTVVGPPDQLQTAIEGVPEGIETDIEEIGGAWSREGVIARLSDRQRAAIAAGIEVGYYDMPRQATHADVAGVLGCAPSTASEHLRKAESKLLTSLFERHTGV